MPAQRRERGLRRRRRAAYRFRVLRSADAKPSDEALAGFDAQLVRGEVTEALEPKQLGEKRFNAEAETSPTVRIWWKTVPFLHKDTPALDLLSDVLSGRTGRLYKGLVLGRQVANEVMAAIDPRKYAGIFMVETTVKDGKVGLPA